MVLGAAAQIAAALEVDRELPQSDASVAARVRIGPVPVGRPPLEPAERLLQHRLHGRLGHHARHRRHRVEGSGRQFREHLGDPARRGVAPGVERRQHRAERLQVALGPRFVLPPPGHRSHRHEAQTEAGKLHRTGRVHPGRELGGQLRQHPRHRRPAGPRIRGRQHGLAVHQGDRGDLAVQAAQLLEHRRLAHAAAARQHRDRRIVAVLAGDPPRAVWSEAGQARRKSVITENCLAPVQLSLHSTPSAALRSATPSTSVYRPGVGGR